MISFRKRLDFINVKDEFMISDTFVLKESDLLYFYKKHPRYQRYLRAQDNAKNSHGDNFPKRYRFNSLQQVLEQVLEKGVPGQVAECGCYTGHSTYIIAEILRNNNYEGAFHIFDSFEGGLSDKLPEDKEERYLETEEQILAEKMTFRSRMEDVATSLSEFDFCQFYKGWIPERFTEAESHRFSFVHVDVDLYQPTLDSLRFFFPRLEKGGAIVVDDYGYTHFPGATKAFDQVLSENDFSFFYAIPTGGAFVIK